MEQNPNTAALLAQFTAPIDTMDGNIAKAISKTRVIVDSTRVGSYQKSGTITAVLRQNIKTVATYPSISVDNNMQQNVFAIDDFDAGEGSSHESLEKRVAFIDVPTGTSIADIQARIDEHATLYKILSSEPILSNNHVNAISRGLTTKDSIADSQVVRYPAGNTDEGQVIPDGTRPVMYRKVFFWNGVKADVDQRTDNVFLSQALRTELNVAETTMIASEAPVNQAQIV